MGEGIGGAKKERRHSLQKSKAMMNLHSKHSKQRNKMCGRASNVKGNLRWLETEEWFKTGEAKHTKKNHTWTKRNRLTGSSDSLQLAPPLCSGCPAWRKAHPLVISFSSTFYLLLFLSSTASHYRLHYCFTQQAWHLWPPAWPILTCSFHQSGFLQQKRGPPLTYPRCRQLLQVARYYPSHVIKNPLKTN